MPSRAFPRFNRSVVLFAASMAVLPLLSGCDNATHSSDLQVDAQITAASSKDRAAAHADFESAAKSSTATPAARLKAKALLADNELQTAQELAATVARREAVIDRLALEINGLGTQIKGNNTQIAALKLYEPSKVSDSIKEKTSAITGTETKPDWYKSETGSLDSLLANDKQATTLADQVSQLTASIKSETDQRTQLLNDADKLNEQSEREKGQKSVDLYTEGSNDRKKAADLTTKLDQDNVLLTRAQADLALRQGQQESLKGSIKLMGDRASAVDERWKAVQGQIETLNTASKTLAGDETAAAPVDAGKDDIESSKLTSISAKVAALDSLVKKNHADRGLALTHFDTAIGFYKDAFGLANDFKRDLSARMSTADAQKPEHDLWQHQLNWLDSTTYRYLQADAELQKAEFFARRADEEKTRQSLAANLKKPMEDGQLAVPTLLTQDDLETALKDTQKLSRDGFATAIDDLKSIEEGAAQPEIKSAAGLQLIFAYYSSSLLESAAGDAQKSTDLLGLAKEKVQAAQANNVYIPSLPAELAPASPPAPAGTLPR